MKAELVFWKTKFFNRVWTEN